MLLELHLLVAFLSRQPETMTDNEFIRRIVYHVNAPIVRGGLIRCKPSCSSLPLIAPIIESLSYFSQHRKTDIIIQDLEWSSENSHWYWEEGDELYCLTPPGKADTLHYNTQLDTPNS